MTDTCPTCGSSVKVVGKTTMHYEPVEDIAKGKINDRR